MTFKTLFFLTSIIGFLLLCIWTRQEGKLLYSLYYLVTTTGSPYYIPVIQLKPLLALKVCCGGSEHGRPAKKLKYSVYAYGFNTY